MKYEDRVYLAALGSLFAVCLIYPLFYEINVFVQFFVQFSAGILGIMFGFSLDRYRELHKRIKISNQILANILVELHSNLVLVQSIKPKIQHTENNKVQPRIDFFFLIYFRQMFGTRSVRS